LLLAGNRNPFYDARLFLTGSTCEHEAECTIKPWDQTSTQLASPNLNQCDLSGNWTIRGEHALQNQPDGAIIISSFAKETRSPTTHSKSASWIQAWKLMRSLLDGEMR